MRTTQILKPASRRNGTRRRPPNPADIPAGVIGLGLMGRSIIACLLSAGHDVVAVTRSVTKHRDARRRIAALLREMDEEGTLNADPVACMKRLTVSGDVAALSDRALVIESIIENIETKKDTIRRIEAAVPPDAIIGSNTSAIPISFLQAGTLHPERLIGMHWAEPAHVTRFMEIICGAKTGTEFGERALALARVWGKEPTLVRRDIRGFIANRLMYAMMREAFHLVDAGYATPEDVDRAARNDMGCWITLAGPFRFMDLTGIPAYGAVMKDLFPELSDSKEVPELMKRVMASGALGVSNARGFYDYTPAQARRWEKAFLKFSYEIRALARKYPQDLAD
jgi:3-hydroxybutyryl-CoA dehydrogenase